MIVALQLRFNEASSESAEVLLAAKTIADYIVLTVSQI